MSISLDSQNIHTIRVRLPPKQYHCKGPKLKDKLWIYFQKNQVSGGCDVDDVNIIFKGSSGWWMTVTFSGPSGVQHVLAKQQHELNIDGHRTSLVVHAHDLLAGYSPSGSADFDFYMKSLQHLDTESISKYSSSDSAPDQSSSPSDDTSSCSYTELNPETLDQHLYAPVHTSSPSYMRDHTPSPIPADKSKTHVRRSEQKHTFLQEQNISGKSSLPLSVPLSQERLKNKRPEGFWPGTSQDKGSDKDSDGGEPEDDSENELQDLEHDGNGSEGELRRKEEENIELVVEVTDFKPTTSDEMLRLHFENNRRSGGGNITTWERDTKTGTIKITFQNPSVARSVVDGRVHRAEGTPLSVRLLHKKKPRPRPLKKRCLFLRGIPDKCSSEHLTLFIENRSGMDDPKIQYGEIPGTALCTFKEDIPDVEMVVKKISSKKLMQANVTAETVNETDSILVQGLSAVVSLEWIELFFDNKKKSGGGGVREVEPGPADGQAIVYFEDWKVVGEVLSRCSSHTLGNADLSVDEYYDNLGRLEPRRANFPLS